jgi:stearoyl-CoA desaturase (delta-9 desaturase)
MLSAKKLFLMQLIAHIATIYWILIVPEFIEILTVLIVYFFTGCIGMSVTYHRLLTHRSFTTSKFLEYFGTLCATLGLTGSSISWTAAHRIHHSKADRIGDPHSPKTLGYIRAQFLSMFSSINVYRSPLIRCPGHQFFHKYYLHINVTYALLISILFGLWGLLNLYLVPACVLWNAGSLINTINHTKWLGYRRFNTPDNSTNNPILGIIMWGEGWHNNHHRFQNRPNIGEKWWEIDIGYYIIKLIKTN